MNGEREEKGVGRGEVGVGERERGRGGENGKVMERSVVKEVGKMRG